MKRNTFGIIVLLLALVTQGLGCYSFTGASIPSHIHTIAIPPVDDLSSFGQSDVRQSLTNFLVEKFTREGSLQVAQRSNADALLEVTITRITDEIVGVQAGGVPSSKRVTVFVEATYRDQKKQKTFWQRQFQQSGDYAIAENITGEKQALQSAVEKLAEELMLAVISNW